MKPDRFGIELAPSRFYGRVYPVPGPILHDLAYFFEDAQATWRAMLPSITNPLRGGEKKVRVLTTPANLGSAPRALNHALPHMRPRCCFRYLTFFGINMMTTLSPHHPRASRVD